MKEYYSEYSVYSGSAELHSTQTQKIKRFIKGYHTAKGSVQELFTLLY